MTETANEAHMKVEKAFQGIRFLFRAMQRIVHNRTMRPMLGACTERNKKGSSASLAELIRGRVVV